MSQFNMKIAKFLVNFLIIRADLLSYNRYVNNIYQGQTAKISAGGTYIPQVVISLYKKDPELARKLLDKAETRPHYRGYKRNAFQNYWLK